MIYGHARETNYHVTLNYIKHFNCVGVNSWTFSHPVPPSCLIYSPIIIKRQICPKLIFKNILIVKKKKRKKEIDFILHYLKNKRQLVSSCLPFRNSHGIFYVLVDLSLTSLPWFCKNSTSCWEKVVMEIDLTLWGGLSPLLQQKQTAWLNATLGRNVGTDLNTDSRNV